MDSSGPSQVVIEAANKLYAGAPAEFIAARKALAAEAKAGGDKDAAAEILTLRKPDVAAWAINLVVYRRGDAAGDLVGLGARMRAAQAAMDVGALQGMRAERDEAVSAFVAAAVELAEEAGARLALAAQDAVRSTAIAVLADEGASEAVSSGMLTKPLSYSGFGEVDVSDAVALTGSGVLLAALPGGGSGVASEEDASAAAKGAGRETAQHEAAAKEEAEREERLARARKAFAEAEAEEARTAEVAAETREALEEAEAELAEARRRYDEALRAADAARVADAEARAAATSAIRERKKAAARLR